jgi:hypothetical protein
VEKAYYTYTNSLIINKTVLVPTYYTKYDTTALRIYRQAMPGYRVIGINSNSIIPQSGTIHCTSHEIGAYNPLLISHQALENTDNIWTNYPVNATIMHKSGISSAIIYYRTDTTQPYLSTPMTLTNASTNTWSGEIPFQVSGTYVYYYIWAQSVSGKTQVRPMPAPLGWWRFRIYNPNQVQELNANNFSINIYSSDNQNYNLIVKSSYKLNSKISILSPDGKKVKEIFSGVWPEGTNEIVFDKNNISQGLYLVKVETNRGTQVLKFIVK